jgi:hypothetical protein
MYDDLSVLPHFDTSLTDVDTPEEVVKSGKILMIRQDYIFHPNIFSVSRQIEKSIGMVYFHQCFFR